jgi:biotin carboxyl carrier protein
MLFAATVLGRTLRVEVTSRGSGYAVTLDGRPLEVDALETADHFQSLLIAGRSHELALEPETGGFRVHFPGGSVRVELAEATSGGSRPAQRESGPARVSAPMPGRVLRVLAAAGDEVEAGQALVVVEAMKMENELRSPRTGRVEQVAVREGQAVEAGALLVVIA